MALLIGINRIPQAWLNKYAYLGPHVCINAKDSWVLQWVRSFPRQLWRSFCLQLISCYISIIIGFCLKYLLNGIPELRLWWSWTFLFLSKDVKFRGQDSHLLCLAFQFQHCYGTWDLEQSINNSFGEEGLFLFYFIVVHFFLFTKVPVSDSAP